MCVGALKALTRLPGSADSSDVIRTCTNITYDHTCDIVLSCEKKPATGRSNQVKVTQPAQFQRRARILKIFFPIIDDATPDWITSVICDSISCDILQETLRHILLDDLRHYVACIEML